MLSAAQWAIVGSGESVTEVPSLGEVHLRRCKLHECELQGGRTRRLQACRRGFAQQLVRAAAAALRVWKLGCGKGSMSMRHRSIGAQQPLATLLRLERAWQ